MKKIFVFLFFVGLLAGCHESSKPIEPTFSGKISVVIDGKQYESQSFILRSYWPESNNISFGVAMSNKDESVSFVLNNVEANLLESIYYAASGTQAVNTFTLAYNKGNISYRAKKGQYLLESREGNRIKARFWGELTDLTETQSVRIEGGVVEFILPDRRYTRE